MFQAAQHQIIVYIFTLSAATDVEQTDKSDNRAKRLLELAIHCCAEEMFTFTFEISKKMIERNLYQYYYKL